MIILGKKVCDCCKKEKDVLYVYEGKALCLACIKKDSLYTCDYCHKPSNKLFWHDADLICGDCLKETLGGN